jgi:crossover junction endodeoxyribonuclease RuvC
VSNRVWIGIDCGVSGAVAVIEGGEVRLFDTPTRKAQRGEAYLPGEMADLLRPYAGVAFCVLEQATAPYKRRGQAGEPGSSGNMTAAVKTGQGMGLWEGILAAFGIAYELAPPATWKREFRLVGQDKKASRARACELFPAIRVDLGKKRPDFSEALLLADYGRRRNGEVTLTGAPGGGEG